MSLLTIIQDAADRIGIPRPSAISSATDQTTRQLMALSTQGGQALMKRHGWTALQTEATFTTIAAEDQGAVATLFPGFDRLINRAEWDRDRRWPLGGPVSPQYWQQLKSVTALGPFYSFRIRGGRFLLIPTPAAGVTLGLEYISRYWVTSADGTTGRDRWTLDTDVTLFDEEILTADLVWRFKAAKGFSFDDDKDAAERLTLDAIARDGARRVLDMADPEGDRMPPRIQTPEGSWNVS